MASRLTSTSYALLGLLTIQPWSAYELTKYMRRSALSGLWPRAEASIYREPKNLVEHGLATATTEEDGDRSRTVYEITQDGRQALAAWLEEPGDELRIEGEFALKVFFGDAGSLESVKAQLASVRRRYEAKVPADRDMLAGWLGGMARFPHRLQYMAMAADLVGRLQRAVAEWAVDWEAKVDDWETTDLHPTSQEHAEEWIRTALARMG